ncbi:MAG: hypothetical protein JXA50_01795 [Deltaproteobacteria bacterium]|nr:hypothetical protein [Deltaproteobacteria bacterium]
MKTKKVQLEDREVEVRRFLATQIEEFFAEDEGKSDKEKQAFSLVADVVVGGFKGTRKFLTLCTDLSEGEITKLDMEEYSLLVEAMKELNPNFFAQYRSTLTAMGRALEKIGE